MLHSLLKAYPPLLGFLMNPKNRLYVANVDPNLPHAILCGGGGGVGDRDGGGDGGGEQRGRLGYHVWV